MGQLLMAKLINGENYIIINSKFNFKGTIQLRKDCKKKTDVSERAIYKAV